MTIGKIDFLLNTYLPTTVYLMMIVSYALLPSTEDEEEEKRNAMQ